MNSARTRYLLLAGVVYFGCMALAHFFSFKVPVLFVYYDTPYHVYQDKIIAFAVVAYMGLFYVAARDRAVVPVALFVLAVTVVGLAAVNLSSALALVLVPGQSTLPYWVQTAAIGGYLLVLAVSYARDGRLHG